MYAEQCEKTKQETVLFNYKRLMKEEKENGMKKNLKLMKKFVLQDRTITSLSK